MSDPRERFDEKLRASLADGSFAKLTLSEPAPEAGDLRNVYGRIVPLKGEPHLSLAFRYARRDETKNFRFDEGARRVQELLGAQFGRGYLFTTAGDWQWRPGGLKASRPQFTVAPVPLHDQQRPSALPAAVAFLRALGVTNAAGDARPGMADKLRQIQRFTELLGHLFNASPLRERRELRIADMGAGKGYLTFATHEFFRARGIQTEIVGIEERADLVALTEGVARELDCRGLHFRQGSIAEFDPVPGFDVLIALHACNTATDDALYQGLQAGAALLLVAPCCHQELRPQMKSPPVLREVLSHGILAEREAELLTDGLRGLLLELRGYKASVFEFIGPEHTGKNLMIAAHRREPPRDAAPLRENLHALLDAYGIREQRLARLLGEL